MHISPPGWLAVETAGNESNDEDQHDSALLLNARYPKGSRYVV